VLWWRVSCHHVAASKLKLLSKCSRNAIQTFFSDFQYLYNAIGNVIFIFIFSHFQTLAHSTSGYCVSIFSVNFLVFLDSLDAIAF